MKGLPRRLLSLLLTAVIAVMFFVPVIVVHADNDDIKDTEQDANMNLDVVFVLDSSGSMLDSDPHKVALDAFNLFVDLCDETCGIGYVVYSEKIKDYSNIIDISNKSNLETMKKKISSIQYDPYGDTDISLGLTKAMNIHDAKRTAAKDRKKVIILLSDGNTHLIGTARSMQESQKEMETTLNSLKEKNIPVYSIGLNYDKTLDKKELEKISKTTGGTTYETSTSDKLTGIISDIFSNIYKLDGIPKEIVDGKVTIEVKDSSVFYVNIIIRSSFTLEQLAPVITTPEGRKISVTPNNKHITGTGGEFEAINITSAGTYTLMKLIYPRSGNWIISLKQANNDNCKVTQLDFYSVYVKQTIQNIANVGDTIPIEASLNDRDGVILDEDLLKTIKMKTIIQASPSGKKTEVILERDFNGVYKGTYTATEPGGYWVSTTAESNKFKKESHTVKLAIGTDYVEPSSAFTESSVESQVSEESQEDNNGNMWIFISVLIAVLLVGGIIIVLIIAAKNNRNNPPPPPAPAPAPEKPLPVKREAPLPAMPERDAQLIDYQKVEHGSLESLIKKGPEDAFNMSADDYKTDEALEKLIKKGDDPFSVVKERKPAPKNTSKPAKSPTPKPDKNSGSGFAGDSNFGIKKDDDAFGSGFAGDDAADNSTSGSGFAGDSNFGIKKDDDAFGSGFAGDSSADDSSSGSGFAGESNFGIKKDDDVFGSGFANDDSSADFGIKKDDDTFGSGFAGN